MKATLTPSVLLLAACVDFTGLAGDPWRPPPPPPPPPPSPPAGIALKGPVAYNLLVGDTLTYRAFAYRLEDNCPDDPFAYCWVDPSRIPVDSPVTWRSSDTRVAAVTAGGLVTALAPGTVAIRATAAGFVDSAHVTVVAGFVPLRVVATGTGRTCALSDVGRPYCWGVGWTWSFLFPTVFAVPELLPRAVPDAPEFARLSAGGVTCGLTSGGAGFCWGSGPLGVTDRSYSATPVVIGGGHVWRQIAVGTVVPFAPGVPFVARSFACGVAADSTAWCWGDNSVGQLGRDSVLDTCGEGYSYACSREPIAVSTAARFVLITAGATHACGLTAAGETWCWGDNAHGQLGDGSTMSRSAPALVTGGLVFTALAAGPDHTCGLSAGEAYCWGRNDALQLGGAGPAAPADAEPARVPGVAELTRIAANGRTCALTVSGTLWCWGAGIEPAPVTLGQGVTDFAVGDNHACAITADGRARCWGSNYAGQLGAWAPAGISDVPLPVAGPVF